MAAVLLLQLRQTWEVEHPLHPSKMDELAAEISKRFGWRMSSDIPTLTTPKLEDQFDREIRDYKADTSSLSALPQMEFGCLHAPSKPQLQALFALASTPDAVPRLAWLWLMLADLSQALAKAATHRSVQEGLLLAASVPDLMLPATSFPLHVLAFVNSAAGIDAVLKIKHDLNLRAVVCGETAIEVASSLGHVHVVSALLSRSGSASLDIQLTKLLARSPNWSAALECLPDGKGAELLVDAIQTDNAALLQKLITKGLDLKSQAADILMQAARNGAVAVAAYVLEGVKCDPHRASSGPSPFSVACALSPAVADVFLSKGPRKCCSACRVDVLMLDDLVAHQKSCQQERVGDHGARSGSAAASHRLACARSLH